MTERKLQALRNLAERPGTAAEGQLARELLARLEAKKPIAEGILGVFQRHLRGEASTDEFLEALRRHDLHVAGEAIGRASVAREDTK